MMYEYIGVGSLNFPKYYETEKKNVTGNYLSCQ